MESVYPIENFLNKDIYLTLVFEITDEDKVKQKIYVDGELLAIGDLNKEYYKSFIIWAKTIKYMEFGRSTTQIPYNWCYTKGNCYAIRLYNKGLSDEEVMQILYRKMNN